MSFPEIRALFDLGPACYGLPAAELAAAEARLHLVLPATLRQYYAELGAYAPLNHSQDNLLLPNELRLSAIGTHLVFYAENQWVCTWGIALTDLALPDPPVWISYDDGAPPVPAPAWQPESATLSRFLLAIAHQQALFAWPFAANAVDIGPELAARVRAEWPVRPVALAAWGATYFQAAPGHLLALFHSPGGEEQTQTDLFVAAKNRAVFELLLARLDVEWEYNSLEDEK